MNKHNYYYSLVYLSYSMTQPTKWHVLPAKTQISLVIRPVWSESSLSAWRSLGWVLSYPLSAQRRRWSDRWMARLILVFARRTHYFVGFVMRRLIKLVKIDFHFLFKNKLFIYFLIYLFYFFFFFFCFFFLFCFFPFNFGSGELINQAHDPLSHHRRLAAYSGFTNYLINCLIHWPLN